MTRKQQAPSSAELQQAKQQFQHWRQHKQPRERIPQALWKLAVDLVPTLGLNPVAQELKLDYYSLKKRVQPVDSSDTTAAEKQPAFVELPPVPTAPRQCVLEADATGNLRIHLTGYQPTEIALLGRQLREEH